MIDKEKVVQSGRDMCRQNGDWRDVLEKAPGAASLRIALAFYASKNLSTMTTSEKDEYRQFREALEAELNADELKYLVEAFERMGIEVAQKHYEELLRKKSTGGTSAQEG